MKYDGENAYVLFACNLHKERNSMRMIAVAADKVTLYAIIGNEVLHGNMDYKGYAVVAHAIKGSSKILGAIKLSEKALMMEEAAKAENEEVLRREEKAFLEEFKSVIAVMEKELAD